MNVFNAFNLVRQVLIIYFMVMLVTLFADAAPSRSPAIEEINPVEALRNQDYAQLGEQPTEDDYIRDGEMGKMFVDFVSQNCQIGITILQLSEADKEPIQLYCRKAHEAYALCKTSGYNTINWLMDLIERKKCHEPKNCL